jgi:hypothetical protein
MPRKTKTTKKRPQRRKSPEYAGIESMNRTMQAGMNMIGNVTVASLGVGLAGSIISKI